MKLQHISLLLFVFAFASCKTDLCKQTVTYTKAQAIYADLEDVRSVPLVSASQSIENAGKIFVGEELLLIGEENVGIHVFDNSNPSNPQSISFLNIPYGKEFFVEGEFLYAESQYDLLKIDISSKNNITLVSREAMLDVRANNDKGDALVGFEFEEVTESLSCDEAIHFGDFVYYSDANQLIPASSVPSSFAGNSDGTSGSLNRIGSYNDHIYVVNHSDLIIMDASASDLVKANEIKNFDSNIETIIIRENQAFLGKTDGLSVVSLDNTFQPEIIAEFRHEESCDPVYPYEDVAYVTLRSVGRCPGNENVLDVVDLNGSSSEFYLNLIQEIPMDNPIGMTTRDQKLYVGQGSYGIKIFDVSDARNPYQIKSIDNIEAYDLIAHPSLDVLVISGENGLSQYSISSDDELVFISNLNY